jgi:hypothetical protein
MMNNDQNLIYFKKEKTSEWFLLGLAATDNRCYMVKINGNKTGHTVTGNMKDAFTKTEILAQSGYKIVELRSEVNVPTNVFQRSKEWTAFTRSKLKGSNPSEDPWGAPLRDAEEDCDYAFLERSYQEWITKQDKLEATEPLETIEELIENLWDEIQGLYKKLSVDFGDKNQANRLAYANALIFAKMKLVKAQQHLQQVPGEFGKPRGS